MFNPIFTIQGEVLPEDDEEEGKSDDAEGDGSDDADGDREHQTLVFTGLRLTVSYSLWDWRLSAHCDIHWHTPHSQPLPWENI